MFHLSFALDGSILGGADIYLSSTLTDILKSDLNPCKVPKWEVPVKLYPLPFPIRSPRTPFVLCDGSWRNQCKEALRLGVSSEVEEGRVCCDFRELSVLGHRRMVS